MPSLLVCPAAWPPSSGTEYGWARATQDGASLASHGSAPLALLPATSELTLLVPGSALSWHRVTLPPGSLGSTARLYPVLEGLLEEHLLDEPSAMHCAVQPGASTGTPVWVAACERAALRAAVHALEGHGRRVTHIAPEFTPQLEEAPALVFATGEPQAARLTVCDASGVITLPLDAPNAALALSTPFDTASASTEPGVAAQAEKLFGQRLPIVQRAERWLHAARGPWELAQFDFARTGRARARKQFAAAMHALRHAPQWRAARWGMLVLLLAQGLGLNLWAWKERAALDAKRQAIHGLLTQTFPSVKLVVDAPLQMAREVAVLRQSTGSANASDFEPLLGALGRVLPEGRTPSAIDFSGAQLRLRGLALAPQELSLLNSQLSALGYSVRGEGDLVLIQAEHAQ